MKKIKRLEELTEGRHMLTFQPILWAQVTIRKACDEGRLHMRHEMELIRECDKIRGSNGGVSVYGWIPIPLAYTQVQLFVMIIMPSNTSIISTWSCSPPTNAITKGP